MTTHTYALMMVTKATYDEVRGLLQRAGYGHAIHEPENEHQGPALDMHGLALTPSPAPETMTEATGWAYVDSRGVIDVSTVSPTQLAAKVNAIASGTFGNVVPMGTWTEEDVDRAFLNLTGGAGSIQAVRLSL